MKKSFLSQRLSLPTLATLLFLIGVSVAFGQSETPPLNARDIYSQIKAFPLSGGKVEASNLVLKRDRVTMTFNGTFYFSAPINGKVTGAVFIGQGTFQADVPPSNFEKSNVKRLLNADLVASDFRTAVMRFSDNTFDVIGKNKRDDVANPEAQKLAAEIDGRILKESGVNLPARLTLAVANQEKGFFFANFDGGKLDRFSYLFDPQTRIPTAFFDINAGEKGLIFSYKSLIDTNEILMAFYSLQDYQNGVVQYSDMNDLVDIEHYKMNVDLTTPKSKIALNTTVNMSAKTADLQVIPFYIGEALGKNDGQRLKKQMRVKAVRLNNQIIHAVQEDWESGLTVFLPKATVQNEKLEFNFEFEGDFMRQPETVNNCHYPRSNTTWYPRHGFLDRSTYEFNFRHSKNLKVAAVGTRLGEIPDPENKDNLNTKYSMKLPVSFVTFALGPFTRHAETIKWENGDTPIPLEFNSLSGNYINLKEDFILAELSNSVRYFHALFGKYPYETFSASYHPYGFGQGFPSMLMMPGTDRATKYTYAFISHETAHQWWGNIVAWRSYRDQWLSEGFAEYSGILYTSFRQNPKAARNLLDEMRDSLKNPPETVTGVGKGKLNDVGPLILGQRLNTSKSYGAYQTLIYNKGALVLRMLHFMMTNPADGNGQPFFDMMKDFVEKHRNRVASTDDFRIVANEHFARTPMAQKYGLKNLDWFFQQWVYQTELPSYQLEYSVQPQNDGSFVVSGNVIQENVPDGWFMPLPIVFSFGGDKTANGTVAALGAKTPFNIKLPMKPTKLELDPHRWVLSEKTSTK